MHEQDIQSAKRTLEENIYAAMATADRSGQPWNSPVFVVYDEHLNFYWASAVKSHHSQNIDENPRVFLAIFNSAVPWGMGEGVFVQARAEELTDQGEIAKACELRRRRASKALQPPGDFTGDRPRRIYRATAEHIWINKDTTENGYFVDIRQEIDLESLKRIV